MPVAVVVDAASRFPGLVEIKPKQQRKPITDPELLERRKQELAKARVARAEKLAAAKPEHYPPSGRDSEDGGAAGIVISARRDTADSGVVQTILAEW